MEPVSALVDLAASSAIEYGASYIANELGFGSSSSAGKMEADSTSNKKRKVEDEVPKEVEESKLQEELSVAHGVAVLGYDRHLKASNFTFKRLCKRFSVKLYQNNWVFTSGGTPPLNYRNLNGWMNVIPYQAVCLYISPQEYLSIVRDSSFAEIKESKFQMQLRGIRTPFTAGSTEVADANGNLGFDVMRFDGLEQCMPFTTADGAFGETPNEIRNYEELIGRLYGTTPLVNQPSTLPASMIERGFTFRPQWTFSAQGYTPPGLMSRNVTLYATTLPVMEYCTDLINSNQVKHGTGYCFNKSYKPKNGILTMAGTSGNSLYYSTGEHVRVKQPTRMEDQITVAPAKGDNVMNPLADQNFATGSVGDLAHYTFANLENYTLFNGEKQDANYTKMPSMCIGITPKVNTDSSVVAAIADFLVTTEVVVKMDTQDHLYVNMARKADESGYIIPGLTDTMVYGGKWTTKEDGYPLKDKKVWTLGYGMYGQPIFANNTV